jgi:hypothetical protein
MFFRSFIKYFYYPLQKFDLKKMKLKYHQKLINFLINILNFCDLIISNILIPFKKFNFDFDSIIFG